MTKDEMITNADIQKGLAKRIHEWDAGTLEPGQAKIYGALARTLLSSVKIDIEGSKNLGVPLFDRTKRFLGVE